MLTGLNTVSNPMSDVSSNSKMFHVKHFVVRHFTVKHFAIKQTVFDILKLYRD